MHKHSVLELDRLADDVRSRHFLKGGGWYPTIRAPRGLKELGSGISRIGYLLPCKEHVLKVSYNNDLIQTRDEKMKWLEAQEFPELKELLCPVLDSDPNNLWLLMPLAPMIFGQTLSWPQEHERNELERSLLQYGIMDQHRGNIGFLDGKLISIDYGLCWFGDYSDTDFRWTELLRKQGLLPALFEEAV